MIHLVAGSGVSNAYPIFFTIGALASLLWLVLENPSRARTPSPPAGETSTTMYLDSGLVALGTGLVGARMGFVITHWGYFAGQPAEIFWVWQGGLSWVGGVLGALAGLVFYSALTRRSFWALADALSLPSAVMALSSWWGCLIDGCAYGRQSQAGFFTPSITDMFGGQSSRWPTQTVGALYCLIVLAGIYGLRSRKLRPGFLASSSLSLIAAGTLALSFTRGDPALLLSGFRIDTVGSAAILLVALSGLALTRPQS
jgi:phosphatidylglycerol:prolipoprotein diacylglycerol transferase